MVKSLPAMQETRVRSLDREDTWRRKWPPTPVFLPGKSHGFSHGFSPSHGWRSLVVDSPWGHRESDMPEQQHT